MAAWHATHEITVTDCTGRRLRTRVMLLDGAAYTREEWRTETSADWEVSDDGAWKFRGRCHPSAGSVRVRMLPTEVP